eukprot:gene7414-543_t
MNRPARTFSGVSQTQHGCKSHGLALVPTRLTAQRQPRTQLRVQAVADAKAPVDRKKPRDGNVDGDFFVDETCINCDTCRWMAPETYSKKGDGSVVYKQPTDSHERVKAIQALLSCPTFSIHARNMACSELMTPQQSMPIAVDRSPASPSTLATWLAVS